MKDPYQKWRDPHVFFLDDGFDSDDAYNALSNAGVNVERFRKAFPDPDRTKEHNVEDPRVMTLCNRHGWILLTTDPEMYNMHRKEMAACKSLGVLATANQKGEHAEWITGFLKLAPTLCRNNFKKRQRPWFASFSRQGTFTIGPKLVEWNVDQPAKRKANSSAGASR